MDRNLDLGVMAELLFTEIIMMSFFMPWLWPVKTASETIFSGDLSFCRLLQMQHSGNVINQLAGLDGGWSYGLYLPLVMAMANIYALVFRKIQGLFYVPVVECSSGWSSAYNINGILPTTR